MKNSHNNIHVSVLLNESIQALEIKKDGIYVDGTLGRGGHSELILKNLSEKGLLIGIDQDIEAIEYCKNKFKSDSRVRIIKNNFSNIESILSGLKIDQVDGILLDLGVSSPQLDDPSRGFCFKSDCILDMRMDLSNTLTAQEILNNYNYSELFKIFKIYADVKNPRNLVNQIIEFRKNHKITTSFEFLEILKTALPKKEIFQNHNFANKYFQAIRIAVNDEIKNLETFLNKFPSLLKKDAIIAIISFHSLEDKIVLNKFRELSVNKLPKEVPLDLNMQEFKIINFKGIVPDSKETEKNSRSRSSKLRILKKI